jgi:hypothetical protein
MKKTTERFRLAALPKTPLLKTDSAEDHRNLWQALERDIGPDAMLEHTLSMI